MRVYDMGYIVREFPSPRGVQGYPTMILMLFLLVLMGFRPLAGFKVIQLDDELREAFERDGVDVSVPSRGSRLSN